MTNHQPIVEKAAAALLGQAELADDGPGSAIEKFAFRLGSRPWPYEKGLVDLASRAIDIACAQQGLIEQLADVLDDRGATDAAQLLRDREGGEGGPSDELWERFIGPMVDQLEVEFTLDAENTAEPEEPEEPEEAIPTAQFHTQFTVVPHPSTGLLIRDSLDGPAVATNRLWTVVDSHDGSLKVLAGYHQVERMGFIVTEEPWDSKSEIRIDPENLIDIHLGSGVSTAHTSAESKQ